MNQSVSDSPVRAKRRQSDAKWRASVATCYDALKYVIPNVKNLSKKKISKALILQECEKHIENLESTINYLLHVESKNQGKVVMWKEGNNWTECSMEKLRVDFANKQRSVFHVSARGRRCYSLLQDIKDEVFSLKADPKQMAFVDEDSFQLPSSSIDQGHDTECASAVSVLQFHLEDTSKAALSEDATGEAHCRQATDSVAENRCNSGDGVVKREAGKSISKLTYNCFLGKDSSQMRQQSHTCQRLSSKEKNEAPHLLGASSNSRSGTASYTSTSSSDMDHLQSVVSCRSEEKHQIAPSIATTASGASSTMPSTSISFSVSSDSGDMSNTTDHFSSILSCVTMSHELKLDKLPVRVTVCSSQGEYTCLLRTLETETEQEVPSLETPVKTTRIKRPRLASTSSNPDYLTTSSMACCSRNIETGSFDGGLVQDMRDKPADSIIKGSSGFMHVVRSSARTGTSSSGSLATPGRFNVTDIKADESQSFCDYDPLLSSLDTSKFDMSAPAFFQPESETAVKQHQKYTLARKKLDFNSPSHFGCPGTMSPYISGGQQSPIQGGFTPVKLPDDFIFMSDTGTLGQSYTSPWKTQSSPINSREVPQVCLDSSSVAGLEDTLLCLETIDTSDLDNSQESAVTPSEVQKSDKSHQLEGMHQSKVFYGQSASAKQGVHRVEPAHDSHVVPQFWIPDSPNMGGYFDNSMVAALENTLLCLETLDTDNLDVGPHAEV